MNAKFILEFSSVFDLTKTNTHLGKETCILLHIRVSDMFSYNLFY